MTNRQKLFQTPAFRFVILLGFVSLCADATYEGARSITGAYLGSLGASGAAVGLIAGFGELIGYGFRLVIGYLSDQTRKYWQITILGYALNTAAVPLLALTGTWQAAAGLMIAERTGKAIRTPPRDVLLSHAASQVGRGFGFGVHEAMDQIGAVLGPLAVAAVLYWHGGFHLGFAILIVPAVLGLLTLLVAQQRYPNPRDFEQEVPNLQRKGLPQVFWVYLGAVGLIAAGYADFPLIAFHLQKGAIAADQTIPLLYAFAMGVAGISSLVFGRWFDRKGIVVLAVSTLLSAGFAPLVFLGSFNFVWLGMTLWGIGLGAQESILKAAIAGMVPINRRASAYGIFATGYGLSWFLGSALMGILYDRSVVWLVGFSIVIQLLAIPVFLFVTRQVR